MEDFMRHLSCAFLASMALPAIAQAPVISNPGFEEVAQGRPVGWTATLASGAKLTTSSEFKAEGVTALKLEHPEGASSSVLSAPLRLQVGQLYRLSGWIKAKGVKTDPVARYPTALGACLSMASFPFTNASPTVAGDGARRVSVTFFATTATDQVRLDLGRNGRAAGTVWFDDVRLEKVDDITAHIPLETVRWAGKGFRYEEGGWAFVHIEGEPYPRGHQYGELVAQDLVRFMDKSAIQKNAQDPAKGWAQVRQMVDALFLRKYDVEYLEEMKGIADGATKGGARFKGRELDLLDIVSLNSLVDLDYVDGASRVTATPLTGRSFLKAEEEAERAGKGDHCSSFVATKSATKDHRFVMGQMFMWGGYTGVQWNLIVDVVPSKGHRLVYQTFPGGLHSATDWYLNGAGLVIGETTVGQTPFNPDGLPQSNRIRKAVQYASGIDEFVKLFSERNNGLYTNDWTLADAKTDEGACLLLGTKASRLWRTGSKGHPADTPGNLKDFIWANNNNRDLAVRKEYVANSENAPVDLAFNTWNRDISFWNWFQAKRGAIDLGEAIRYWATSPVQRPHACDGKLTTAEMAEKLMFIAHQGKTTLREKWVGGRYIPDLPGAAPHLTYGYTTFSPVFVTEKLEEAHAKAGRALPEAAPLRLEVAKVKETVSFDRKQLWINTVFPATDGENWLSSGDAAYHALLRHLPEDPSKAFLAQRDALAELNARYLFLAARETEEAPLKTRTAFDRYGAYQMPRIKGTFALHQLRLWLGNAAFAKVMAEVHGAYAGKAILTEDFLNVASRAAGRDISPLLLPWLTRTGLPDPSLEARAAKTDGGFEVALKVRQKGSFYPFVSTVEIRTAKGSVLERVEVKEPEAAFMFKCAEQPTRIIFNAGGEIPVASASPSTLPNLLDEWERLLFVPGTSHQIEANRSLLTNFRDQVADTFTEVLPEIRPDAEVTEQDLKDRDLVLFGGIEENALLARLAEEHKLPVEFGKGFFRFRGHTYGAPEDGIAFAIPSPWNPRRTVYVYSANTRLQLWQMTKAYQRGLPGWAIWRGAEVVSRGYHGDSRMSVDFK